MVREASIYNKESAYPRFVYAGFGSRMLAFIIDLIVISAISKILVRPIINILGLGNSSRFFSVHNLLNLGVYLGYFFFLTLVNKGQTLGKMVMGIRVVSLKDEKLKISDAVYREVLGRFILKKIKILYLMALFTEERQQIADIFAYTSVIDDKYFYEYTRLKNQPRTRGTEFINPKGTLIADLVEEDEIDDKIEEDKENI